MFKHSATVLLAGAVTFGLASASASAATYTLGTTYLGTISPSATENGGVNDPFPNALECIAATDLCAIKTEGPPGTQTQYRGTYTGTQDINSVALWKGNSNGTEEGVGGNGIDASAVSYTGGSAAAGDVTVTYQAGDLLAHYLVVKAANDFAVFLVDSLAAIVVGDTYKISWDITGLIFTPGRNPQQAGMSHVSLYNTQPPNNGSNPVPIPGAAILMITGLGGLGAFGGLRSRRKRKKATS